MHHMHHVNYLTLATLGTYFRSLGVESFRVATLYPAKQKHDDASPAPDIAP